MIIRLHSNSKEYTVHATKNTGAIYFIKSKSNLRRWLKVRGWNLDGLNIEWVQH